MMTSVHKDMEMLSQNSKTDLISQTVNQSSQTEQIDQAVNQTSQNTPQPVLLLIDASYSTRDAFDNTKTIFDKMLEIATALPYTHYRVIFWNSPQDSYRFRTGGYVVPFIIEKKSLSNVFAFIDKDITDQCKCSVDLVYDLIPKDWKLDNVYLICHEKNIPSSKKYNIISLRGV